MISNYENFLACWFGFYFDSRYFIYKFAHKVYFLNNKFWYTNLFQIYSNERSINNGKDKLLLSPDKRETFEDK